MSTITRRAILRGSPLAAIAAMVATILPAAGKAASTTARPASDAGLDRAIWALAREIWALEAMPWSEDDKEAAERADKIAGLEERLLATPAESGTGLMFK